MCYSGGSSFIAHSIRRPGLAVGHLSISFEKVPPFCEQSTTQEFIRCICNEATLATTEGRKKPVCVYESREIHETKKSRMNCSLGKNRARELFPYKNYGDADIILLATISPLHYKISVNAHVNTHPATRVKWHICMVKLNNDIDLTWKRYSRQTQIMNKSSCRSNL